MIPARLAATTLLFAAVVVLEARGSDCQIGEKQKLQPSDGEAHNWFGTSTAMNLDCAVVGTTRGEGRQRDAGAAFVFRLVAGLWAEEAKLVAEDGTNGDGFGYSVGISGDAIIVGAPFARDSRGDQHGAVYLYERTPSGWIQVAKFMPDVCSFQLFGLSVAISGDNAIVGANRDCDQHGNLRGSAFVLERVNGTWEMTQKLKPSDGVDFDYFGYAVAIDNGTAVVTAVGDQAWQVKGSAYVFENTAGTWSEVAKLQPQDILSKDGFGRAVALRGSTLVVAAPYTVNTDGGETAGSAFVFERDGAGWFQTSALIPDTAGSSDFGYCSENRACFSRSA